MTRHSASVHGRLALQCVIALLAMVPAIAPPLAGRLLLVPLDGRSAGQLVRRALDHRLLPLAAGPLPGSLIVRDVRGEGFGALLAEGILPLPALSGGCAA